MSQRTPMGVKYALAQLAANANPTWSYQPGWSLDEFIEQNPWVTEELYDDLAHERRMAGYQSIGSRISFAQRVMNEIARRQIRETEGEDDDPN
ncbi:MAG: hypothetical protein OXE05_00695 [Chloroflexi bacterium]|nr:hypothetical protein [Chloroflexota bacterium]